MAAVGSAMANAGGGEELGAGAGRRSPGVAAAIERRSLGEIEIEIESRG